MFYREHKRLRERDEDKYAVVIECNINSEYRKYDFCDKILKFFFKNYILHLQTVQPWLEKYNFKW
jgi:hypothetical protein